MNVLVVGAHPDDELLGCGGTAARLATEGHSVYMAILGEGLTSRVAHRRISLPGA
jgi:N-acetylglucosamine malate deacetylase 1